MSVVPHPSPGHSSRQQGVSCIYIRFPIPLLLLPIDVLAPEEPSIFLALTNSSTLRLKIARFSSSVPLSHSSRSRKCNTHLDESGKWALFLIAVAILTETRLLTLLSFPMG